MYTSKIQSVHAQTCTHRQACTRNRYPKKHRFSWARGFSAPGNVRNGIALLQRMFQFGNADSRSKDVVSLAGLYGKTDLAPTLQGRAAMKQSKTKSTDRDLDLATRRMCTYSSMAWVELPVVPRKARRAHTKRGTLGHDNPRWY